MNDSRLILALDVTEPKKALRIAGDLREHLFAVKVNWPLVMTAGIGIVSEIAKHSRVICDFKLADVPHTVSLITAKAKEHGAYGIITHAFTGRDSLEEIVKTAGKMKVFSVVAMSHPGSGRFVDPRMDELVSVSREAGVHGFIAPGNQYDTLKHIREIAEESTILSPGIGAQGGNAAMAIRSGADYIIVGRSIYNSDDPAGAAETIISSLP